MEFKQLEAFVAVVDYNSFSEAAKSLYLTQPTISAHIRNLEKELRSKLIIRTTKKLELTYRGQQFYECANNILKMRDTLVTEFTGDSQKIISLGASTIPSAYILPETLGAFSKEYPEVLFHIWQSDSKKVIDKVLDGTIDLGFTGMDAKEMDCVFVPFFQDELVIATPNNAYFQKLKEEQADLRVLLKEPLIMRENGSGTQKEIDSLLSRNSIHATELQVVARMNDPASIAHAVANGLGISILSMLSIDQLAAAGKLLEFPLSNTGHRRNLFMVYNRNRILKPHVKQLIHFIKDFYAIKEFCEPQIENAEK